MTTPGPVVSQRGKPLSSWSVLAVTTSVQVLISGAALTPPVFATLAAADMGLETRTIGYYMSLVYLGAMLTSLPAGGLVTRFGAMRVSQVSLLLCGIGLAVLAGAHPVLAFAGALIIGLGYGPVTPASSHILARSTPPERRGLTFSIKQTGVPLGGMLAGAVVPWLVLSGGWQGAALAVGLVAAVLAVGVQRFQPQLDDDRKPAQSIRFNALVSPLGAVWRHRPLRMLALASFMFAAVQLSLSTFLVAYLIEDIALDLVTAGLMLSVAQIGGVIGRIVWGGLADKWLGSRWTMAVVALGIAAGSVATALFSDDWSLFAMASVSGLFGATAIGWNGVFIAEIAHLAPSGAAGKATGGVLFFTYAGVVVGPSLFGLVAGLPGGYGLAFATCAAAGLAGGVLVLRARSA